VRRRSWVIALVIAGSFVVLPSLFIQRPNTLPIPAAPTHYLDDQAGLLSPGFAAAKDQYIEHLSRTMRIAQINIVILTRIPSSVELEEFTIRAASAWKIGVNNVDNGLVLFIFRDNRKLRLEVGYGLEAVITDVVAHRLLAEQLVPAFAHGQFETGIEDFLDVLDKTLEASEAASHRASPVANMIPFVLNVLRNSPLIRLKLWHTFIAADTEGRIVLSLFGLVFTVLFTQALFGIATGVPAILLFPWRLYASRTLRTVRIAEVKEQFSPKNFFARPPPFLISLFSELQLGAITHSIYLLAAIIIGIAVLFVGSSVLIDGLGRYGGAGASLSWPQV
jgi:Beta-propeller domains of methanol dehydrogenase type